MRPELTILLVEDEALIAFNLEDALKDAGFSVHHVVQGELAMTTLKELQPSLAGLVTDIRFGGSDTDGWSLARAAREMIPHLPVVYVSGDSAHEHTARGVPDSIMLQKPFATGQLVTAITTLLNALPPQTNA